MLPSSQGTVLGRSNSQIIKARSYTASTLPPTAPKCLVVARAIQSAADSQWGLEQLNSRDGSVYEPASGATSSSSHPRTQRSLGASYESELRKLEAIFTRSLLQGKGRSQHASVHGAPHASTIRTINKAQSLTSKDRTSHAAPEAAQAVLEPDTLAMPEFRLPPAPESTDAQLYDEHELVRQHLAQHTATASAAGTSAAPFHAKAQPAQRTPKRMRVPLQNLGDFKRPQPVHGGQSTQASKKAAQPSQDIISVRELVLLAGGQTLNKDPGSISLEDAIKQDIDGWSICGRVGKGTSAYDALRKAIDCILLDMAPTIIINSAINVLGKTCHMDQVRTVHDTALRLGKANTHTWGCTFQALADAGRPDAAFHLFDRVCQQGADIGPVGASTIIKLCANRRDLDLALEMYYRMVSVRTTFNRYIYNCLLHLCAILGRVHDALDLLGAMRADARGNPDCAPDGYTYSAILRVITATQKWPLLPKIYKQMTDDGVTPDAEVWCQLITLAGRAGRTKLAIAYFNACLRSGCELNAHAYNALLSTLASVSDLDQMLLLYRQMLECGLSPDAYTFVALLTAMARSSTSMHAVEDVVLEMQRWGVELNTQLGTALVNAYRRAPEMNYNDRGAMTLLVERADDVLARMAVNRQATNQTYAIVASMHAHAGDVAGMQKLLQQAVRTGAIFDSASYKMLSLACEESGLVGLAEQFRRQADTLMREQRARKRAALGLTSFPTSGPAAAAGRTAAPGWLAGSKAAVRKGPPKKMLLHKAQAAQGHGVAA